MLVPNTDIWATRIQAVDAFLTASGGGPDEVYYLATVCQVGLDPLLISISPNPKYSICDVIAASGYFGVNFLSQDQEGLIRRYLALRPEQPDKMRELSIEFERTEHGTPLLLDCIQALECRVEQVWDSGDHRTFLGRLTERRVRNSRHGQQPHRFGRKASPLRSRIKEVLCRSGLLDIIELGRGLIRRVPDIETGTRHNMAEPVPLALPRQLRRKAPAIPGICLVGCGFWGQVHALEMKRLGPRVQRFFASRNPARAREFVRRFDGVDAFVDLDACLADPRVHAVVLALPHHLHAQSARAALMAGKHVLVEKPLALTLEEGRELVRCSDESGLCLAVAEEYRLSPLVRAVHRLIEQGEIGRISLVRAGAASRYRPEQTWKTALDSMGGGVLLDVGIHYIDILRHWFGEPESVWAVVPPGGSGIMEGEEAVLAVLRFPGGPLASLQISWEAYGPSDMPNFELIGDRGSLQLWYRRPYLLLTHPLADEHWAEQARRFLPWRVQKHVGRLLPRCKRRKFRVPPKDLIGSHAIIDDFLRAITTGRNPAVPASEGLRDLELVLTAYDVWAKEGLAGD